MLKDRMDDASRLARFLRREAADYHDPPKPPAEAMWAGVEARLGAPPVSGSPDMAEAADCVGDAGGRPFDVRGYHDPPPAPREAMWERIEAGWVARQPAPGAPKATRGPLRLAVVRTFGRRPGRTAAWLTGAAAASVELAAALDGGPQRPVPAAPETVAAAAPTPAGAAGSASPSIAATDSGPLAPTAAEEALALAVVEEPPETARQFAAATRPPAADPAPASARREADPPVRAAVSSPSRRPVGSAGRATADEYDTSRISRHLDRTQALFVAFRTDIGSDESQRDLARWAREFLVETRSLLNTPAAAGQRERTLLRDLELILVQIARVGPDAPDFERELARESMERQGMLMRLRAASGA